MKAKKLLLISLASCSFLYMGCFGLVFQKKQKIAQSSEPKAEIFSADLPPKLLQVSNLEGAKKPKTFLKVNNLLVGEIYPKRKPNERYLHLDHIKATLPEILTVDFCKKVDLATLSNINQFMDEMEKKRELLPPRKNMDDIPSFFKGAECNPLLLRHNSFDDEEISKEIFGVFRANDYIDTISRTSSNNGNTLEIEGNLKKTYLLAINKPNSRKLKGYVTWIFKNTYGEAFDSVVVAGYSGISDLTGKYEIAALTEIYNQLIGNSLLEFMKTPMYAKYSKIDSASNVKLPLLNIKTPKNIVVSPEDAKKASVVVKNKDGRQGSGFAISNDGYIITNYHMVSGKQQEKFESVSILLANQDPSTPITASVVRCNYMQDLVLLKIDKTFEKAFKLSREKKDLELLDVYIISSPKTAELGQSISKGMISNERVFSGRKLLQVDMNTGLGDSGSPIFEKDGSLQGVVVARLVGYATEGVGFAIPGYKIMDFLNIGFD